MAKNSPIEWTKNTWNVIRIKNSRAFYCVKVSPACKFCYAEVMSKRLAAMGKTQFYPYKVTDNPPELELRREMFAKWRRMKVPELNFITSMTDWALEGLVPDEWIFEILDACIAAPLQTFQLLTKRSKRMREVVEAFCALRGIESLPANIWMMVTVENQACANERIPDLLLTKCKVRGISCEPLLGPIDFYEVAINTFFYDALRGIWDCPEIPHPKMPVIDWVIAGGNSGPKKVDVTHPAWLLSVRDQCLRAGTAFFFKQWGSYYTKSIMLGSGIPTFREFYSHQHWVNKANTWVQGGKCISIDGRECKIGKDFEECAYPVAILDYVGKKGSGNVLGGKTYQEFPEVKYSPGFEVMRSGEIYFYPPVPKVKFSILYDSKGNAIDV